MTAVLISTVNLALSWLLGQMVDSAAGAPGALAWPQLVMLTGACVEVVLAVKAVHFASMPRFMERAMRGYRDFAFGRLTKKSIAAFCAENTASYISALTSDAAAIETGYLEGQFAIADGFVRIVGAMAMMLAYSPALTAAACAFFMLPIVVSVAMQGHAVRAEQRISQRNGELTAVLKDCLSGFSVIKSFKAEDAASELVSKSGARAEQAKAGKRRVMIAISALAGAASLLAQLGTFLAGVWMVMNGWGLTPGVLIVFVNLTGVAVEPSAYCRSCSRAERRRWR